MEQHQIPVDNRDRRTMILLLACAGLGFLGGIVGAGVANQRFGKNEITTVKSVADVPIVPVNDDPIINVVDKTSPAVVAIAIIKNVQQLRNVQLNDPFGDQFFGQSPFRIQLRQPSGPPVPQEVGGGSGFVIDANGLIITNKHVVSDEAASYEIIFKNGERLKAKVVARDPLYDLALLKVEKTNLTALSFADSGKLRVGQSVVAIGNPLGEFPNSVSAGIVSGLGRQIQAGDANTGEVETLSQVIQTDAAINPGNSGGPLLDLSGKVVGLNTAVAGSAENISFAIPANEVARVLSDYKKNGRVVRAVLGVRYVLIDQDIKTRMNLTVDQGALIVGGVGSPAVLPGSGAEKAGLREDDIILKVNGADVTREKPLQTYIAEKHPGEAVVLSVLSGGVQKNISVNLTEAK